jgi:hypothetical protein
MMATESDVGARPTVDLTSSRRSLLKLAGAAAAGAAGATALRMIPASAGGSGNTLVLLPPFRIVDTRNGHGPLTGGHDYDFGPFLFPGTAFDSKSYYGMFFNITATGWTGQGYLSVRGHGTPVPLISNVNFSGAASAWGNFGLTSFGAPQPSPPVGIVSDGLITVYCGGPATLAVDVVIDLFAYLGPDQ